MSLCPACQTLSLPHLTCELKNLPLWWDTVSSKSQARGLLHLDDARQLRASAAAGCRFCCLIVDAVLQPDHTEARLAQFYDKLTDQPIYLQTNYDLVKPSFPEDGVPGSWHIRGLKAFVPVDHGILVGRIRLYAARDSLAGARCDIIGRPPLPSSDSPEAFDLIDRWMTACLSKHQACRETLSGLVIDESEASILPSRVVYVGNPPQPMSPRLLETESKRGHYIALSHCWGSASHRPPMTTQSNLARRLAGIPWLELPRSYQDAITATRRLGFEYIWIDSLCIIQDSYDDWLRESQRMGDVYQRARLTIAASHAPDSSHPCFSTRPPPPPTVELAHFHGADQTEGTHGSIFATLLPADYTAISPEFGSLASRAWATQEWLLSRRMVFYTAGSLVWSCKMISQRETGASFHDTARNSRWKNIVEKYSARSLTQQTDRLIALEGIRGEMTKKRNDDTYCLGLWKNGMPDQLLWYCLRSRERGKCELDLPTWTWASTLHRVRFLDLKNAKNACRRFRFDEAEKTLTIIGAIRKVSRMTSLAEAQAGQMNTSALEDVPLHIVSPGLVHALQMDNGTTIGWCIVDEHVSPEVDYFCLQLMTKTKTTKPHNNTERTKIYSDFVMILQSHTSSENTFVRSGIGTISTFSPYFGDSTPRHVRLQ